MNTPMDPPESEPKLPELKPIIPLHAKTEAVITAEATPVISADSKIEVEPVFEAKPADKFEDRPNAAQKPGSVFTKGLRVCGNCGTELLGETCYQCGQPTKGLVRQFSSIMGDFLDTVLNIDTRLFRTLGPLIYKPGYLTQEYFSGRRIRYVSPVRLFFFLAILTFLLAQFSLPDDMQAEEGGNADAIIQINNGSEQRIDNAKTIAEVEEIRAEILAELSKTKKEVGDSAIAGIAIEQAIGLVNRQADQRVEQLQDQMATGFSVNTATVTKKIVTSKDDEDESNISFNGQAWHPEKNPIKAEWAPDSINKWFNSLAQRAKNNGKKVNQDPAVIFKAVLSALPMTLFLMLPIFALLLKVMFIFKRRLYMEHLIVALHSHAFLMVAMFLLILFNDISAWLGAYSWVTVPLAILSTLLWIWMPIYLFLMQKRVYQQGWILTFIKYAVIGNLHFVLLTTAITFTLAFKMIWL